MSGPVPSSTPRTELTHRRLYDAAKAALLKIFVHPYASVCELYCGTGLEAERWEEAHIGHYTGIDKAGSGIAERTEAWESLRKCYTTDFFQVDPCADEVESYLADNENQADLVCCLQHLQLCFESEDKARKLLYNVSSLLKPGGYFFGITPDSSTIWAKYQKNVEAYHNRIASMKPGIVPNCIRSESYMITFEVEEEKLAREAGLEYIEIQNLTEFYDDNRAIFSGILASSVSNFVDPRGRLLPRSYDLLGLYTTFIFQKPDPDAGPPLTTPLLLNRNQFEDEIEMSEWREDEPVIPVEPAPGLGKISEQKGILGPGPPDLRFSETFGAA